MHELHVFPPADPPQRQHCAIAIGLFCLRGLLSCHSACTGYSAGGNKELPHCRIAASFRDATAAHRALFVLCIVLTPGGIDIFRVNRRAGVAVKKLRSTEQHFTHLLNSPDNNLSSVCSPTHFFVLLLSRVRIEDSCISFAY